MHTQELYCATCGAVVLFEQPPCAEAAEGRDQADERPEWACSRCGEAILLAPLTITAVDLRPRRLRAGAAAGQCRAA